MAFSNGLGTMIVFLTMIFVHHAAAANGEDFSNNLVSDLAPILALFGEKVAKQFMSQSMGWADNVMFAMAPLGIITAIVAAIRVGGPTWLKAIIGRARENNAAAEVELMSSTSQDVCELWNGQSIVRLMGAPPILEILYLHDLLKKEDHRIHDHGLFTLEEAEKYKHLQRLPRNRSFIEVLTSSFPNIEQSATDQLLEEGQQKYERPRKSSKIKKEAPNIFLNLNDRKSRQELCWWALFSIGLQLGALIVSGLITYFPSWGLKKGGKKAVQYAYPFTASGTIVLVIGMLICSHVVEQRTIEEVFQIQSDQGYIFWLQRGGEVGGQQFDSFAMFAKGPRDSIRTSRLIEFSKIDSEHQPQGGLVRSLIRLDRLWKGSKGLSTNPSESNLHFLYQVIATLGCLISLFGFIIQFIGLRGMHWLATVAQLIATLMMMVVRAWVRRDLTLRPKDQKLCPDHELDWIATRIVRDYKRLWPDMNDNDEQSLLNEDDGFWEQNCCNWVMVSGMGIDANNLRLMAPQVSDSLSVVTVRKRLGSLSNWSGPFSDLAISVATVIEAVMNSLCSFSEESYLTAESMYWSVNSGANSKDDGKHEQIYLRLNKVGSNGPWKADVTEIEAVLSLWLYSIQHKERDSPSLNKQKGNEHLKPETDWLRHGDAATSQDSLRFLGRCLPDACRDLIWYMGSQASIISVVKEQIQSDNPENGTDDGSADVISFDNHRVVGFRDTHDIHETGLPTTSVARDKRSMPELWMSAKTLSTSSKWDATGSSSNIDKLKISSDQLAVFSDHDLKILFAQDLFSTFMWAVAKKMNPVNGETRVRPTNMGKTSNTTSWQNFKLENSKLYITLRAFEKAKLGSFEDACLCVIPPLSRAKKLPDGLPVIRYAHEMAEGLEMVGRLEEAGQIYMSLFQVGRTFDQKHMFSLKATATLFEFLALINNTVKRWTNQLRDFEDIDRISALELKLRDYIKTASELPLEILSYMYRLQNRDEMNELLGTLPYQSDKTQENYEIHNLCGFTSFHPVVIEESGCLYRGSWQRENTERDFRDLLGWTPLHYVATDKWQSHESLVYENAKQEMSQDSRNLMGWTALHIAAQYGCVSVARKILQEKKQLEARGRDGKQPLHCAVERSRETMVEWLIETGADIEARDNSRMTPLHWGACCESKKVIDILVEAGAKIKSRDDHDRLPLHYAAMAGRKEFLDALSDPEIIDAKDKRGRTPLHLGARLGKESVVPCLLEKKADILARDFEGNTVLHVAAGNGQPAMVQLLLEKGIDIEAQNSSKSRPLHLAAQNGDVATVRLLLEKKADIEAGGHLGQKALHYAVKHAKLTKLLLENGAYVEAQDDYKQTALKWAVQAQKRNEEVIQLLEEFERKSHQRSLLNSSPSYVQGIFTGPN